MSDWVRQNTYDYASTLFKKFQEPSKYISQETYSRDHILSKTISKIISISSSLFRSPCGFDNNKGSLISS